MLKKLIKHEFRATSKTMWPIFIGMLALTLITRFCALPLLSKNTSFGISALAILIVFAFGLGIFALGFAPMVVSGGRFKKSILGQEGYLTMSLPVNSHQLIGAKLITNAVWYLLSGILLMLLFFMMVGSFANMSSVPEFIRDIIEAVSKLDKENLAIIGHFLLVCLELLLDMVMGISLLTVMCYAAYSIGYSVNKKKGLLTVALIFVFFHIISWAVIGSLFVLRNLDHIGESAAEAFIAMQQFLAIEFIVLAALSAIFYFVTNYFINQKLNLE